MQLWAAVIGLSSLRFRLGAAAATTTVAIAVDVAVDAGVIAAELLDLLFARSRPARVEHANSLWCQGLCKRTSREPALYVWLQDVDGSHSEDDSPSVHGRQVEESAKQTLCILAPTERAGRVGGSGFDHL